MRPTLLVLFAFFVTHTQSLLANNASELRTLCHLSLLSANAPADFPPASSFEWQVTLSQLKRDLLDKHPDLVISPNATASLPQPTIWNRFTPIRNSARRTQSNFSPSLPVRLFNDFIEGEGYPDWQIGQPDWQYTVDRVHSAAESLFNENSVGMKSKLLVTGGAKVIGAIGTLSNSECPGFWVSGISTACRAFGTFAQRLVTPYQLEAPAAALTGAVISIGTFLVGAVVWPQLEDLLNIDLGAPTPYYNDRGKRAAVGLGSLTTGVVGALALYYSSANRRDSISPQQSPPAIQPVSQSLRRLFTRIVQAVQTGDSSLFVHTSLHQVDGTTGISHESFDLIAWWNPEVHDYQLIVIQR